MNKTRLLVLSAATTLASFAPAQGADAVGGWFAYGSGIGVGGFQVSTAGGQTEVVVPCGASGFSFGSRFWVLARHNAATGGYDQAFVSPVYDENDGIRRVVVADVDPMAGPEIVVATKLGRVEVWNQASRALLGSLQANTSDLRGLAVADVDGDGDQDAVVCEQATLTAFDLDGTVLWTLPGVGGDDLTIGQMDADPALEIATTDGSVVDCGTEQLQWQWGNGFGIDVDCADIDGDGFDEVVFGESWSWAWAFDVDVQLPKWSLPLGDIACIRIAEVDGDPALEVLVGEGQWGDVLAYDSVTQQLEYTYNNPEHGVTSVAAGDVDGDGAVEVLWGAGFTSTGPDYWFVADATTQQQEWQSPDVSPGFVGPVRGDVDGDGDDEFVCVAPGLGYSTAGPRVLVVDATTLALEHLSDAVPGTSYGSSIGDVALADVDGDGDVEIFVADSRVTALDWNGTGLVVAWQVGSTTYPNNSSYRQVAIADMDNDGALEVACGGDDYVHVFDYGASVENWHSFYLGGAVADVAVADSDGAGPLEIHALSEDGNLYVFDGATYAPRAIVQDGGTDRTALHVLEGLPALILGDELGHMYLYIAAGTNFTGIGPLPVAPGRIDGLGYYPSLGLLHVASEQRVALQFGLTPAWITSGYGASNSYTAPFGTNVTLDLGTGRLASCGHFGLAVFDL